MAVGKSSLVRANNGLKSQKTIDKKAVLENAICDVQINALIFEETSPCNEMVESIKTYGLICPVVAVKYQDKLIVIDGAKRVSALKSMNINDVKVVVVNGDADSLKEELLKYKSKEKVVEKIVEKVIEKVVVKKVNKPVEKKENIHEEKFKAVSQITSALPIWML